MSKCWRLLNFLSRANINAMLRFYAVHRILFACTKIPRNLTESGLKSYEVIGLWLHFPMMRLFFSNQFWLRFDRSRFETLIKRSSFSLRVREEVHNVSPQRLASFDRGKPVDPNAYSWHVLSAAIRRSNHLVSSWKANGKLSNGIYFGKKHLWGVISVDPSESEQLNQVHLRFYRSSHSVAASATAWSTVFSPSIAACKLS